MAAGLQPTTARLPPPSFSPAHTVLPRQYSSLLVFLLYAQCAGQGERAPDFDTHIYGRKFRGCAGEHIIRHFFRDNIF